ncbi:F0F1-type ATP synthase, gamma subunit [Burkholderia sp. Ch1-1]|uniref:F0F1-type ATP synthase, gamma subunit n=1 Tax=Paraburkholderia dioscoreae TaxID=2604047 RepID=A0A5Q4ZAM0_9BURK|nr:MULTISPECIES: F0F1 ATP synthase subunit gamma [Paraburkholderia]EIF30831.1 F0F1-type ATP synthase, gamma subunit [Burkholderia sp. Ch1-1]MDR8398509.1 F0F1 ATP synthase subunit gamma [Paraburkholderia sp. USG1]VVD28929.1 F0F1-type ATP synthase, gamma subunit [Paraburkholderia dioscoreae]
MSGRLAEIEARTATARQLDAVIGAMRGIAAARSREAQRRLPGIRSSAATVGAAIGAVLAYGRGAQAPLDEPDHGARIVIALCSEQGFVGSFNEQVLDYVRTRVDSARCELLLVGTRGEMAASERRLAVAWSSPAVSHADEVPSLANRITDALYARLGVRAVDHVSIIHALPGGGTAAGKMVEHRLIPFDYSRFQVARRAVPPLLTLPVERLLPGLVEEYVFVEICEALMLSFAAENEARVNAMLAARTNVRDTLEELTQSYRRVRQDEITDDIAELAAATTQPV